MRDFMGESRLFSLVKLGCFLGRDLEGVLGWRDVERLEGLGRVRREEIKLGSKMFVSCEVRWGLGFEW